MTHVGPGRDLSAVARPARRRKRPGISKVLTAICGSVVVLVAGWGVSTQLSGQSRGSESQAQTFEVPRTAWGDPDLQGQWNSQTSTPLERPATGELASRDTVSEEEAEALDV